MGISEIHPISRSIDSTVSSFPLEDRSLISQVVERVLVQEKSEETGRSIFSEAENTKMDEVFERVFSFSEGPEAVLSHAIIYLILETDWIESFCSKKRAYKKNISFFDAVNEQTTEGISYANPVKKISKGAASIEKAILGEKGRISRGDKNVQAVFSKVSFVEDILNLLSITGCCVSLGFRAKILHDIQEKIKELRQELKGLPEGSKEAQGSLQEKIDRLSHFYSREKRALQKKLGSSLIDSFSGLCDAAIFCLDISQNFLVDQELIKNISLAGDIVGAVSSGWDLIRAGFDCFEYGKNFVLYKQWLEKLHNRLPVVETVQVSEAQKKRLSDDFQEEQAVVLAKEVPVEGDRAVFFQSLKKESRERLVEKWKDLPDGQKRAELSAHILVQKKRHMLSVQESGSEEEAKKKEMFSVSLKNGLTSLACAKRNMEKKLYTDKTVFMSLKTVISIVGLVTTILGIVSVLCPPIAPLVFFGVTAAGLILSLAFFIYRGVTRPNTLLVTWGSFDGWTKWFHELKSKWYGWRLEKTKRSLTLLEQKIGPTCLKIEMLKRIKDPAIRHDKKAILSSLGLTVPSEETVSDSLLNKYIELLRQDISKKDVANFHHLRKNICVLSERAKMVDSRLEKMQKAIRDAYEKDNLNLMGRGGMSSGFDSLLTTFKEGIAERLIEGDTLCKTVLQDMFESTGISFDAAALNKALDDMKKENPHIEQQYERDSEMLDVRSPALQDIKKNRIDTYKKTEGYAALLQRIGEPIGSFVARIEGRLYVMPSVGKVVMQKFFPEQSVL